MHTPRLALALTVLTAATAHAQPDAFTFGDWDLPARATVTHELPSTAAGDESVFRYRIELTYAEDDLRLSFTDVECLQLEGRPARDAPQAELVALITQLSLPDIRISPDGIYLGIFDLDATLQRNRRLCEDYTARLGSPPDAVEDFIAGVTDDAALANMERATSALWRNWVQCWIGLELRPGQTDDRHDELQLFGAYLDAEARFEHLGPHEDGVLLSFTRRLRGPEAAQELVWQLEEQLELGERTEPLGDLARITDLLCLVRLTVHTDPRTLRPTEVRLEREQRVRYGRETTESETRARWQFDWD